MEIRTFIHDKFVKKTYFLCLQTLNFLLAIKTFLVAVHCSAVRSLSGWATENQESQSQEKDLTPQRWLLSAYSSVNILHKAFCNTLYQNVYHVKLKLTFAFYYKTY